MRRISVYFISLLIAVLSSSAFIKAQDTILVPLKIKAGIEVSGPVTYFTDKNILNSEAYISADLNEKKSLFLSGGFLSYKYSQYNYNYQNKGAFLKAGIDFNLLKPDKAAGRYWAGIGLRYGISLFNSEFPSFKKDNYWGTTESSIPKKTSWGHFIEVSPGVRTEIFRNLSLGWNVNMRMLVHSGAGKNLKPIYIPGYGNGTKTVVTGLNYFIVWSIPYKKINVILKKEVPQEPEEPEEPGTNLNRQQNAGIRQ
jgi:hypothetical protein